MVPVLPLVPLFLVAMAAPGPGPALPAHLLHQGRPRQAAMASQRILDRDPDNPDAMATLAAAWSNTGHHADANAAFELALGSAWYESRGIEAHADSLRAAASPRAAALHTEHLRASDLPIGRRIRLYIDIIDDHRSTGSTTKAWTTLWEALGVAPNAPALLAASADLRIDEGDLEGAAADLWLSLQRGPTLRAHLASGRLALHQGRPEEALDWHQEAMRFRSPSPRLYALRAEALRQLGHLQAASDSLDAPRARQNDDPEIMAVRLRILDDQGASKALGVLMRRTTVLYPANHQLRATLDALRSGAQPG
ncbi:MAG: tetratricopeptide repeat protein [Myxococcota bacterium]|nr:tetratricopeptide repeat protein [Myxococcota bacterium]